MKKLMYFAAALLVLVGCNKNDNIVENAPEGTPFEKGQKVTLTVGTGAQQGPNRVAGVDNTADNKIDFTWEEGDQILVKVGENTATFTLSSGAGLNEGVFAGEMPAGGTTFDIQYPIETPDLSAQVYTTTKTIPADKMLFTATNCTLLSNEISLTAQYAMVQLNLFGTDKTVGKIVFKDITTVDADPITLTLPEGGVEIGATSAEATPLYMVVPTGSYKFEVEVYDAAATPAMICSFATSAESNFTAGKCLNMPAKIVPTYVDLGLPSGLKWATCNLGATTPEGYGDYFAWGETSPKESYHWNTYKWCNYTKDPRDITLTKYFVRWIITSVHYVHGNVDNKATLEPEDDAAHVNWGGNWRMPTAIEIEELINTDNCTWEWKEDYNSLGVNGHLVTSKKNGNSIFLPASGSRGESQLSNDNFLGDYWSSSLNEDYSDQAFYLFISPTEDVGWTPVSRLDADRSYGQSVRPVCK